MDNTSRDYVLAPEITHAFPEIRLPANLLESADQTPRREELIPHKPECGFQVQSLLTGRECRGLVDLAEKEKFKSISWEYDPNYRSCTRVVLRMPELAAELWRRIRPLLHVEDIANAVPFGYGASDTDAWRPYGVNECIRFTKYQDGDHFAMHRDGAFVLTDEERSVHTLMVYLNNESEFKGGDTVFYLDAQHPLPIRGSLGKGLVFKHNLWHEGKKLESGVKYILRTDLMFVRVALGLPSAALRFASDPKFHKAEKLYQKSIALQKAGNAAGSTGAYLAALKIHAEAGTSGGGGGGMMLPADVWVEILSLLSLSDILHRVWSVSRSWRNIARHPRLWKMLFQKYFQGWSSADKTRIEYQMQPKKKTPIKDWYGIFVARWKAKHEFAVVFADLGSVYVRCGMIGQMHCSSIEPSLAKKISGHYWTATSGLAQHMCGWQSMLHSWGSDNDKLQPAITKSKVDLSKVQIILRWVLLSGCGKRLTPREHPLLLARPPEFSDADCTHVGDVMRTLVGVPCIAFVDPAVCTLAALDFSSGIVFGLNRFTVTVTVVDQEVVLGSFSAPLGNNSVALWKPPKYHVGFAMLKEDATTMKSWSEVVLREFATLTEKAMALVDALSAEKKEAVCAHAVLRGLEAHRIKEGLEEILKRLDKASLLPLDSRPVSMVTDMTPPDHPWMRVSLTAPPASLDVVNGLMKLCATVDRARNLFPSVPPCVVKFNRTLLLLVSGATHLWSVDEVWRRIQEWYPNQDYEHREIYDDTTLTRKQIKFFYTIEGLTSWWSAMAPQLEVAMRAGLVRIAFSPRRSSSEYRPKDAILQRQLEDIDALLAWRARCAPSVPLMLMEMPGAKPLVTDLKKNLFVLGENSISEASAFLVSEHPHKTWRVPMENVVGYDDDDM